MRVNERLQESTTEVRKTCLFVARRDSHSSLRHSGGWTLIGYLGWQQISCSSRAGSTGGTSPGHYLYSASGARMMPKVSPTQNSRF